MKCGKNSRPRHPNYALDNPPTFVYDEKKVSMKEAGGCEHPPVFIMDFYFAEGEIL